MKFEGLVNLIHREATRVLHRMTRETVGVVSSYDPQKHAVKVDLQPEGETLSGWIPLRQPQAGKGYGWHIAPQIGDHVSVAFHEDDREGGTIIGAFFNDKQAPLSVEAGECRYKSPFGPDLYFKKDGTVYLKNKDGTAYVQMDPDGTLWVKRGNSVIQMMPDGTVYIAPQDISHFLMLGGAPSQDGGATYDFVETASGPSINVKARIG